jgi:outer membrane protein
MKRTLWMAILLIPFWVTPSFSADIAKIGVVDFQKILETSSSGKAAQAEIKKKGRKMEADLKKRGSGIEDNKKKLEREALVMSKEMRQEKERELRININDFRTLQKKYMADFKKYENRLVNKIQKEVLEIVKTIGKKSGYLLIVERREGGALYYPDSIDITDSVIKSYNSKYAKKK